MRAGEAVRRVHEETEKRAYKAADHVLEVKVIELLKEVVENGDDDGLTRYVLEIHRAFQRRLSNRVVWHFVGTFVSKGFCTLSV